MPVVEVPNIGNVEFPNTMRPDEIESAIKKILIERQSRPQTSQDFISRLGQEVTGGMGQMMRGAGQLIELQQGKPSGAMGFINVPAGALRMAVSPGTAAAQTMGEHVIERRAGGRPQEAAVEATLVDLAIQGLTGGAVGKVAKGLSGLARQSARFLPGAGTALREEGAEIVRRVPGTMKPPVSSESLFAVVEQMNPMVKVPEFTAMAKKLAKEEARLGEFGLGAPRVSSVAGKIKVATEETKRVIPAGKFLGDEFEQEVKFITESKDVPFQVVQDVRRRLGQRIGSLRKSTTSDAQEQLGSFKQMFSALSKDLEKSAAEGVGPAFQALKEANQAARREFISGEVDDLIQPTLNRVLEGTDRTKTAFAKLLNDIREKRRDDPLFASAKDSFVVKNLNDLEGVLDELRKIPIAPPPKGVFAGSAVAARRTSAGGLIGGGVSSALGMGFQPGAIVGGVSGIAGAEVISKLLQTQGGRHWLLNFVKKEPGALFNPQNFAMMSNVARAFSIHDLSQ